MLPRLAPVLLAALFAAALVPGCGGDDDRAGSAELGSTKPVAVVSMSKAQYAKRASTICTEGREERLEALDAYVEENRNSGISEEEAIEDTFEQINAPSREAQLAKLRSLGAPAAIREDIEEMLILFEKTLAAAKQRSGTGSDASTEKELNRAGALARRHGLRECTYG